MRSDIERHPSKYVILNGLSAVVDPNTKTGQIKENDPSPYYPYHDLSKHPDTAAIFANKMKQRNHSKQVIYQKDRQAYYGPDHEFTVHESAPSSGLKVKVTLGDLSKVIPSENNISQLEKELDILNQKIKPNAVGNKVNKQREVYNKDSLAYYDPTSTDLLARKAKLEKSILDLKLNMKQNNQMEMSLNPISVVKKTEHVVTQNKLNGDVESSNKAIADNYFYPTGTNSNIVVINEPVATAANVNIKKVELGEIYFVEKTLVETVDEAVTKTEANPEKEKKSDDKTEEIITKVSKRVNTLHKLDTQGMKTERVRIISLRKHN